MAVVETGFDLVIFDCDGVLINSEEIASHVCADAVAELGLIMTPYDYASRYAGMPVAEAWRRVEADSGRPLPEGFREKVDTEIHRRFDIELAAIDGMAEVLRASSYPRCVASSTRLSLLQKNLAKTGLIQFFERGVFSVSQVKRGKPAPDVFLFAASQMGADPARCVVIEDSVAGVTAGRRAGMDVIGFMGGGHSSPAIKASLEQAGARRIAANAAMLKPLLA
ncbi:MULTISPECIES: HAD-IA family hydrolase [unclassified Beijerinckia]|uniref:HAD family hydrolase n=1 Tax=unclassified Beijerinckia TaxID=2638183 RepID=UPI00089843A4|nr:MULTISPECIES: HAD-IA family hydrolase [unclassified Beijerinckia]MDH7795922.1 HAD superfamily hydrolase (TIGR01509 family) [Beijerinckia sp. GAS462]SEC22359.1 haloacid dehalogenase superfamily, subfamily IA, variant 3 with third motif having DD or ED [Beijerinckia sp. 28-YEA-48]